MIHLFDVSDVFCGHCHHDIVARSGSLEVVTVGALGKPLDGLQSGIQIIIVRDSPLQHRLYDLGGISNQLDLNRQPTRAEGR